MPQGLRGERISSASNRRKLRVLNLPGTTGLKDLTLGKDCGAIARGSVVSRVARISSYINRCPSALFHRVHG